MDWNYIKRVLGVSVQSVEDSADEILNSLTHLESEVGRIWIENAFPSGSKSIAWVASLVELDKCLKIADVIKGGNVLKRKLLADFQSEETQSAMTEAQVAIRLVSGDAQVEYEPQLPGEPKKPDLLAVWDNKQVAFEVTRLALSAEDTEQWRERQASIANACGNILPGGSLDIYITEAKITQHMVNLILKVVQGLVSTARNTDYLEHRISETIYLAYDPTGSVRKDRANAPVPTKSKTVGSCITDVKADRSEYIKENLGIISPMPVAAYFSSYALSNGYKIPTIVRVYRVANDSRVMSKAIEESTQLPSNIPGAVVIDMSSTTARLYDWTAEIHRKFGPRLYTKMSAVWLRSGVISGAHFRWTEYLILNPYATIGLENVMVERISPSGQEINPDN